MRPMRSGSSAACAATVPSMPKPASRRVERTVLFVIVVMGKRLSGGMNAERASECASGLCLWNAHPEAVEGRRHAELAAQPRIGLALGRDGVEQRALHLVGRRQQAGESV